MVRPMSGKGAPSSAGLGSGAKQVRVLEPRGSQGVRKKLWEGKSI
jgi:hypothetical protein